MFKKTSMIAAAVAVAACIGAGSASAATLYTTSAHTVTVPVGTTFTATTTSPPGTFGYQVKDSLVRELCEGASVNFKVTQNSGGTFKAAITGGALNKCAIFHYGFAAEGQMVVTGSSAPLGSGKAWTNMTFSDTLLWENSVPYQRYSGSFSGATGSPPSNGVSIQQPASAAPVSIVFDNAGTQHIYTAPAGSNVTTTLVLQAAAASYSFN